MELKDRNFAILLFNENNDELNIIDITQKISLRKQVHFNRLNIENNKSYILYEPDKLYLFNMASNKKLKLIWKSGEDFYIIDFSKNTKGDITSYLTFEETDQIAFSGNIQYLNSKPLENVPEQYKGKPIKIPLVSSQQLDEKEPYLYEHFVIYNENYNKVMIKKEQEKMKEWVNVILEDRHDINDKSFIKVVQYMCYYQIAFIPALKKDLELIELSHIKLEDNIYAIINDKYMYSDFNNIISALCKKYKQDTILTVYPPSEKQKKIPSNVSAIVCKFSEKSVKNYNRFTISVYEKYRNKITNTFNEYVADKEPEFDVCTYRLKRQGNQGGMLGSLQKKAKVENILKELSKG